MTSRDIYERDAREIADRLGVFTSGTPLHNREAIMKLYQLWLRYHDDDILDIITDIRYPR
jgi:hypothetical protein